MKLANPFAAFSRLFQKGGGDTLPFSSFEWMLAGRYLRSRKGGYVSVIAGFSFVGIMLGVMTLIVVMAVMNGFRAQLMDKILGMNGHIIVNPVDTRFTDYSEVALQIGNLPGVVRAHPMLEGQALISGRGGASGAIVRGVRTADLLGQPSIADNLRFGSIAAMDDDEGVAIGIRMARALGVAVGDRVSLVTPRGDVTPFGVTPRIKSYEVSAIFEVGMSEYDAAIVFMPLLEAQSYFNQPEVASAIEVFVTNADQVEQFYGPIESVVNRSIFITDWRVTNATFFNALQVERNVIFLTLTLIVLIAAFNIISGLIMLVKDKGQDIAIMRTMGASRGSVMRVFFITGASIGVVGTLVGLMLGLVICANAETIRQGISWLLGTELFSPELYYLSQLPAEVDTGETTSVVLMALILSFLATLYPAYRASTLDPVEALRNE